MARIRNVKPGFFRDEKLQDLQAAHPELNPMLVFSGLWTVSDKNGVFEWLPRTLKLDILPFLNYDLVASLALLERFSLISRFTYESKEYGFVHNFSEHQRVSGKELATPSKYPPPPQPGSTREVPEKQPDAQEGNGVQGKGEGEEGNGLDGQVHEIAALYPRVNDAFHLPQDICYAIAEAIARDGRDVVWVGTKSVRDATATWPASEMKFLPSAQKFFRESNYRNPPEYWGRSSNGNGKPVSKADLAVEQQLANRNAARRALGLDSGSTVVGGGS